MAAQKHPLSTPKMIVILQSNYLPWKGYFDLMAAADEFLIYDEVQFTKGDWRNRNRIILGGKLHWLTVAVRTAGTFGSSIEKIEVCDRHWARSHWSTIQQAYRSAPHWHEVAPSVEAAYRDVADLSNLTEINERFMRAIAQLLGLKTPILRTNIVARAADNPSARLVEICRARGATAYLSGPAARSYLRVQLFEEAEIALHYADYSGYPTYPQGIEPFEHGVSILDTLFQCGSKAARSQLKSIRQPGSLTGVGQARYLACP